MKSHRQIAIDALRDEQRALLRQAAELAEIIAKLDGEETAAKPRAERACCKKGQVIDICAGLLRDNGSLSAGELEGLAKDKVKHDLKMSLSGFAIRFEEALRDARFVRHAGGQITLATELGA